MGLTIGIDDLALFLQEEELDPDDVEEYRHNYALLDAFLRRRGFPGHQEPEHLGVIPSRGALEGFPYSWLHSLRRAFVYQQRGLPLPVAEGPASHDPVLEEEYRSPRLTS